MPTELQPWTRAAGPGAHLPWLVDGSITEEIPSWFIDFFLRTRDIGAVKPGETDNCTMTTVEDNWCLYRLVQEARPARSLEIGIMRGSSSITIAKAIEDAGLDCVQTAVDIDPEAAAAASRNFRKYGLHERYVTVVADSREWIAAADDRWQFVFLDGDHSYDTVAVEFAHAWNRTDPGGIIVLHDTGSVQWGTNEDPGRLFFRVLDGELGDSAEMTWLDSTSCETDMKLRTSLGHHSTLPTIAACIAVGYGGLGIVRKLDDDRSMSAERFLSLRPHMRPVYFEPAAPTSTGRRIAERIVRRMARAIGI